MASRVQSAPSTDAERGFTLIELLVVISIIGLLISIVVPSMAQGRAASKMALCLSNQRQLGLAIQAYAMNNDGAIPRGPNAPLPHDPNIFWDSLGSNQVWIETLNQPNGLGSLLQNDLAQPGVLFCPGDDTTRRDDNILPLEQRTNVDIHTSFLYRQRDQTTRDRFDDLGRNELGLPARALLFDLNVEDRRTKKTCHRGNRVGIVYLDGHAQSIINHNKLMTITALDLTGFPYAMEQPINQLLIRADHAEHGDINQAPLLP
ncbi:MAG: type II secretion system protein [Phycisphaerae bacterium]|nr:type II secretion system GspH family protein [Phycisphaerae bacterium]NUQ46747.1 type II secretion system protein [Phycisphaerae bacterium]